MKKLLPVLFVLLAASAAASEPNKSENVITLTTAVAGFFNGEFAQPVEISYMRSHNRRFYWGVSATTAFGLKPPGGCSDGTTGSRFDGKENLYKLSALVCYDIRLVKWWYLRVGAGIGVGVNRASSGDHQVRPYFDVQANWLFKFKRIDVLLSPLIVLPSSKLSVSPFKRKGEYRNQVCAFGPSIGVGVKF